MNTAEAVTAMACGTVLALGAGAAVIAWRALRDGWVKGTARFELVGPAKRFEWPKPAAAVAQPGSAAAADDRAPAAAAEPINLGPRRTA